MSFSCTPRIEYREPTSPTTAAAWSININTATAAELENLPYIGQKTAKAIIDFRGQNGPFRRVEHLMLIPGVSEKRFNELSGLVTAE